MASGQSKAASAAKPAATHKSARPWPPRSADSRKQLYGYSFAFFGEFAVWPSYHGGLPAQVAALRGASLREKVDATLDCVVLGDRKGAGRAEARRRAEKLQAEGAPIRILGEPEYRELVRIDLTGKRFFFVGGFDCSPGGLDDGVLPRMVERVGGVLADDVSALLDYLVVGNRQGSGKVASQNKATKLNESGAAIARISESAFLELVRVDSPAGEGELDFAGFLGQLYGHVNEAKLGRALAMLRADRHELFSSIEDARLVGVVKSQSGSGSVYASWLSPGGGYGCTTPDLTPCMGLQGTPCKHLLVLVVGLARAGELSRAMALEWMKATRGKSPRDDEELCAETFVRYKGAEAGEIDWRPTETIPEDFYAC